MNLRPSVAYHYQSFLLNSSLNGKYLAVQTRREVQEGSVPSHQVADTCHWRKNPNEAFWKYYWGLFLIALVTNIKEHRRGKSLRTRIPSRTRRSTLVLVVQLVPRVEAHGVEKTLCRHSVLKTGQGGELHQDSWESMLLFTLSNLTRREYFSLVGGCTQAQSIPGSW